MRPDGTRPSLRRRSLSRLLQVHHPLDSFLSRSPGTLKYKYRPRLDSVPVDVLLEIAERLQVNDVLSFSLSSSHMRAVLIPTLYSKVDLRSSRHCKTMLDLLSKRPTIARHVRELILRPNYYLAWPKPDGFLDEFWVVDMVQRLAKDLQMMHTFVWDGLEMPDDQLWLTLRMSCPKLRTISSSVGLRPLDHNSHLFSFENLVGFELIVRCGLGSHDPFPELEDLPDRLWDMLLNHCPDLEDLIISCPSASPRLFNFRRIIGARWPKLRSLTLGCIGYQSDFTISPAVDLTFAPFLDAHPTLETLGLQWNYSRWWSPETLPMELPKSAIPKIKSFSGLYQQLGEVPNPGCIETLDLTFEPIPEVRVEPACAILKNLTSLTTLDIWLYIPNDPSALGNLFRSLLTSCPKLSDLHLMCTSPFTSKPLKLLSQMLHLLPNLTSFSLTKGHRYSDEDMLHSALRVLRHNPRLKQVMIRWVRQACPNHCKQIGTYDVTCDSQGKPLGLLVREKGVWMIGKDFFRRYRYNLPSNWGETKAKIHGLIGV